jgi:hypothetical protein
MKHFLNFSAMWRTPCRFIVSTSLSFYPSLLPKICSECLYVYKWPNSECAYRSYLRKQAFRTCPFLRCITFYWDCQIRTPDIMIEGYPWKSLYFLGCEEIFHFCVKPEGSSRWTLPELAKSYLFMIYFNIILPHTTCPKYDSLLLRFLIKTLCDFSHFLCESRRKHFNS